MNLLYILIVLLSIIFINYLLYCLGLLDEVEKYLRSKIKEDEDEDR